MLWITEAIEIQEAGALGHEQGRGRFSCGNLSPRDQQIARGGVTSPVNPTDHQPPLGGEGWGGLERF